MTHFYGQKLNYVNLTGESKCANLHTMFAMLSKVDTLLEEVHVIMRLKGKIRKGVAAVLTAVLVGSCAVGGFGNQVSAEEADVNTATDAEISDDSEENLGAKQYTEGYYTYTLEDGCTIVGYSGSEVNVVIPDKLGGYKVKAIDRFVFDAQKQMKTLDMGSNLEYIGYDAFRGCNNLQKIKISPKLKHVEGFDYNNAKVTELTIPASIMNKDFYGGFAFKSLKKVTFENGGQYIPSFMFSGASSLTSVTIPDSVKTIARDAFSDCSSLTTVNLGKGVERLEYCTFRNCTSLTRITFSPKLIFMEKSFRDCTALVSISLPKSLFNGNASTLSPFVDCTNLKNITIPSGAKIIPATLFDGVSGLEKISIPNTVTMIGGSSFGGCESLKTINIGVNVTCIGSKTFWGCLALQKAAIYNEAVEIGEDAFRNCPNLTIYGYSGSTAHKYAKENEIPFVAMKKTTVTMYRLYNPNSGEHFYTSNSSEISNLVKAGWKNEGRAWRAPIKSKTPVYRLYNPNAGDHHYTTSASEKNSLVKAGWKYEGIGWYSDDAKGTPLYRLYNPNAKAGSHHYTISASEKNALVKAGWKYEGIAWYGK